MRVRTFIFLFVLISYSCNEENAGNPESRTNNSRKNLIERSIQIEEEMFRCAMEHSRDKDMVDLYHYLNSLQEAPTRAAKEVMVDSLKSKINVLIDKKNTSSYKLDTIMFKEIKTFVSHITIDFKDCKNNICENLYKREILSLFNYLIQFEKMKPTYYDYLTYSDIGKDSVKVSLICDEDQSNTELRINVNGNISYIDNDHFIISVNDSLKEVYFSLSSCDGSIWKRIK